MTSHTSRHFFYSLLRYHDVRREESLIVGVLLLFPDARVFRFLHPSNLDRLTAAFPDCPVEVLRAYFAGFTSLATTLTHRLEAFPSGTVPALSQFIAAHFLAEDSSALQFSEPRIAALIPDDLDKVIQNFYQRYLQTYERAALAA